MEKVAIQGNAGSYNEIAALEYFGEQEIQLVNCSTFRDIFKDMEEDGSLIGFLAIENTIAGSLLQNYELLRESGTQVIAEYKLRVSHCLACLPYEGWKDIIEIDSHPITLMQYGTFLESHPEFKIVETGDTATGARETMDKKLKGHAAICSKRAVELYGMKILQEGMETNKHNFTRFLVGAGKQKAHGLRKTEKINKASIVFSLPHVAGSLSQILSILSFYHLDLTKIQSLPIIGREWEYLFYIDVTFTEYLKYRQALDAILPLTNELKNLGEYASFERIITWKS